MIEEESLSDSVLLDAVFDVYENRNKYISAMENSGQMDSIQAIIDLIEDLVK